MSNIIKSYNGITVQFSTGGNTMVNVTPMAKAFGTKPDDFLRTENTMRFIETLTRFAKMRNDDIIRVKQGGKEQGTWMHETLALKFAGWLAPEFELWMLEQIKDILLGNNANNEALKRILLNVPREWQKTFPDDFFAALLKCWCDESVEFKRSHGTPSFCGWFINKYVYEHLWAGLPSELKARRKEFATETDELLCKLHQFLTENAKEALHTHTAKITGVLQISPNKEYFKAAFDRAFVSQNQLGMRI
jgi:hypothetical protein